MKQLICLLLTAVLALTLTACSPRAKKTSFQLDLSLTGPLLQSDAFSEPLEPLEEDLAWMLYGLEEAGLTQEQLTGAIAFRSSGATCEELALLTFADETAAQTAAFALAGYIATQIEINKDYRPRELPKLEQVFLERRGTAVLLMVANDYETAYQLLAL